MILILKLRKTVVSARYKLRSKKQLTI